jgi:dihydrofolate reductase
MRKIIFMMSVSLDGYFEGPDHDLGWQLVDEELHQHFNDWLATAGGFLDGRVTYELMASHWPAADQDPAASAQVIEFSRIWRDMPKIVFSRTLEQAGWNTTIVREVVPEQIAELKARPGASQGSRRRENLISRPRAFGGPVRGPVRGPALVRSG